MSPDRLKGCTGPNCLDRTEDLNILGYTVGNVGYDIVNLLTFVAGLLAVIFIIVGGIKYASSSGDPKRIESAKQTLLYAVIGLVVAMLARVIIGFVISGSPQ